MAIYGATLYIGDYRARAYGGGKRDVKEVFSELEKGFNDAKSLMPYIENFYYDLDKVDRNSINLERKPIILTMYKKRKTGKHILKQLKCGVKFIKTGDTIQAYIIGDPDIIFSNRDIKLEE